MFKRGPVWWISFVYNGIRYRQSSGTGNKKLAQKIEDKVKGDIVQGKWFERLPGEEKTLREMMQKYLAEHSAHNKTPSSHERDNSLADHLIAYFGDTIVAEISPNMISGYKNKRRKEGAAPKTINNELILLGHAFSLAIKEWEWVRDNPVRKVSKEKVDNQIERWLTQKEEEKLLSFAPLWLRQIVIFAINTGLRQSEILDLIWWQVDLSRRTVAILKQKNKGKDTLPLNARAMAILKERALVQDSRTDHVFYNGNVTRINARNLLRAFHSAAEKAGIKGFRVHDLRHTFATRLVQSGVDIYTVQKLGRWKTISMVMRYAHHYPESLRSGVEALDKIPASDPGKEAPVTIQSHRNKKGAAPAMQPLVITGSGAWI